MATACPIPELAPVTMAVWLSNGLWLLFFMEAKDAKNIPRGRAGEDRREWRMPDVRCRGQITRAVGPWPLDCTRPEWRADFRWRKVNQIIKSKKKTLAGLFNLCIYTKCLCHNGPDLGWGFGHVDAVFPHDSHFSFCGIISATNDGTSMPHSSTWRGCLTGDKAHHRFLITIFADPTGCFRFIVATNFANHDDGVSLRLFHQQLNRLLGRSTDDGVSSNANCSRYTQSRFGNLVSRLIS